jgi:hypothetical protein
MSDMKIVTFKKEWRGYAIGETAGFDPVAADALIESGRAKPYVEKATSEKPARAPAAKSRAGKNPVAAQNADAQTLLQQQEQQLQQEQEQEEEQEQEQEQQEGQEQENEEHDEKP